MTTTGTATSTTSATSAAAASSASSTSTAQQSADQFLKILLTELQNQNPTDAVNTTDFTTQLAQYSSLEQQIDTNSKLDTLISDFTGTTSNLSPTAYLGATVDYTSTTAPVQNSNATWTYSTSNAATVNISVADASGNVVYTGAGDATSGTHTFTLGASSGVADGTPLTISITAADSTGASVTPTVNARATVSAVDTSSGTNTLEASGYSFPASEVTRISGTGTATSSSAASAVNSAASAVNSAAAAVNSAVGASS